MRFIFHPVPYAAIRPPFWVSLEITLPSGNVVEIDPIRVDDWEALKKILGSGAVGMQMQGQDIQVEIK